ncbi:uncharacterized protein LOC111566952 [Amphiprion ocellaris]|uniref:uncharacterized protein LOC111566952 n=1 Tax=Amphiprion ocellaris TaxID=80972 RepID=UPI0024118AB2|nr:uncharacterized protein LOC111566952 [Amphiprion ocellaris]
MARTQLILIFLLQFTAGISGDLDLYYRLGNDVTLPCGDVSSSETICSLISWLYNRRTDSQTAIKVKKGKIDQNLPGAERLSLSRNCSLIINKVTAEDAGRYTCRFGDITELDAFVYLNILTISPSPPDADPKTDDEVTLKCSLLRYNGIRPCPLNSIRWVDEKGTVLLGESDGYKFNGQMDCVSLLTVKHQSSHNNRRYTCQFTERNNVKIDAHYPPVFTDSTDQSPTSSIYYIMLMLRIATLVLMLGITVGVITYRGRKKLPEDTNVHFVADTGGDTVDYENVGDHSAAAALH